MLQWGLKADNGEKAKKAEKKPKAEKAAAAAEPVFVNKTPKGQKKGKDMEMVNKIRFI